MTAVIVKILHPFKYPGLRVITCEQMKNSFTNCPPCLLAEIAKVARLVARPRKCYINRLERFIQRHIRNHSTNQIAGSSLFSSEIILMLNNLSCPTTDCIQYLKTQLGSEVQRTQKRILNYLFIHFFCLCPPGLTIKLNFNIS